MVQRDLDFEINMTAEQWAGLGRAAQRSATADGGFAWSGDRFDEIDLFVRDTDVPDLWRDYVSEAEVYGARSRAVGRFHFNGGRPYASIELSLAPTEPVFTEEEEAAMQRELELWVRARWHALLRDSGLHYDRGHIPPDRAIGEP